MTSHIPGTTSGPYPAWSGNLVRPLVDGEAIARRLGEAVEAARHSVWLTVAFCSDDFSFPDGRGLLFDVLDRTAASGVDVRLLVGRPNPETKIMLVDDVWATIGSCNLHFHSMGGNAEMNASIWDAEIVRTLRQAVGPASRARYGQPGRSRGVPSVQGRCRRQSRQDRAR